MTPALRSRFVLCDDGVRESLWWNFGPLNNAIAQRNQELVHPTSGHQFITGEIVGSAVTEHASRRGVLFVLRFLQRQSGNLREERRFFVRRDEVRLVHEAGGQALRTSKQLALFH